MKKNYDIKERVQALKDKLGLTDNDLASMVGKSTDAFRRYLARNEAFYPQLVMELSGRYGISEDYLREGEGELEVTRQNLKVSDKGVPFYDIEITGTNVRSFADVRENPEYLIDYMPFNDCTAYLPIYGDSMFPQYCSGETLAVKQITNFDSILWGEAHLIITNSDANDMKTVKLLHPSDNPEEIILRASNPNYKGDTIVKKAHILSLYIIKGKITRKHL